MPSIRHLLPIALVLCCVSVASASAATTRFASPAGTTTPSECTDAAAPCALPVALAKPAAGDTISLAAGTYDVKAVVLPRVPLHWTATDKASRPLLTSDGPGATLAFGLDETGSSLDGLEVDNTSTNGVALNVGAGADAPVRSTVLKGPHT